MWVQNTSNVILEVKFIEDNFNNKLITCMVSFDISNSFNTIHIKDLLEVIDDINLPNNLKYIIGSYLKGKKIMVDDKETMDYNVGV